MRYFEMFAGVGGFGIGIQRAYERNKGSSEPVQKRGAGGTGGGPDGDSTDILDRETRGHSEHSVCVGFSEIDSHASAVLRYHHPDVKNYGDCTKINWSEVPDFDLLVGGSPCQDFSIAGKRAGLVGARSGLAYEYIRCLEEKRPARFIWENVRGVLSSNRGWDFAAILNQMAEAGYALQWQVLNAKHFGVPQNRERVFVIGTRTNSGSPREVFFEQRAGGKDIQDARPKGFDGGGPQDEATSIDANYHKGWGGRGKSRGRTMVKEVPRIRRLMPLECERLMSWPDGHTAKGRKEDGTEYEVSDTQRYKMCGNGVVSEVVSAIVSELYHPLTNH